MRKPTYVLVAIVIAAPFLFWLTLSTVLFAVDRTEFVYVTQFGRHVATFDGARDDDAGLHWRWPWPIQSVQSLDRRLQYFDLPGTELLTRDVKRSTIDRTIIIVPYACWRITDQQDGVDWFIRRVGTPEQARVILGQQITSQFGAAIGQMEMSQFISEDPGTVDRNMKDLRQRLLESLQEPARNVYGIDVVDIRLRRVSYPPAVRQAIFERINSERQKKVADYQSEGAQLAANIKSEAERDSRNIRTEALATEQRLKGEADAEADRTRNLAHAKDPEFYAFLKRLEDYQRILGDNKTWLLLSTHRELFDLLFNPPKPASEPRPKGRDSKTNGVAGADATPGANAPGAKQGAKAPRSPVSNPLAPKPSTPPGGP
jgi:membrane protease subunit HflC